MQRFRLVIIEVQLHAVPKQLEGYRNIYIYIGIYIYSQTVPTNGTDAKDPVETVWGLCYICFQVLCTVEF